MRRIAAIAAGALLVLAVASGCTGPPTAGEAGWPPLGEPRFDVQGHRGARGHAPENTLAAFRRAIAFGVTTLETDLGLTRDGVLVLSHDSRLNPQIARDPQGRWIAGPGPAIHALTLAELKRYDVGRLDPQGRYALAWPQQQPADGERIPTLAELLALAKASGVPLRFNLETKLTPTSGADTPTPELFAEQVARAVRAAGIIDRVTVQSFDWRTLMHLRRVAPEIPTACLTARAPGFDTVAPGPDGASPWHAGLKVAEHGGALPALVRAAGCATWSMYWRDLDAASVRQAKALGLTVLPWTVNEPADMAALIALGVDGLISDYPDRVLRLLGRLR